MEKMARKSVAPYYGAAAVWVLCALALPLYTVWMFLVTALLSAGVFLLLRATCKDAEAARPAPEEEKPKEPENPELAKMLADGEKALAEMRRLDGSITDEKLSAAIQKLEELSGRMFDAVREDPGKLPRLRRFMDYYLPTTLKLLNAYDRMGAAGGVGENTAGTMERVEQIMDTIVTAFARQLDQLYGGEALDIASDITVLETMLAREGLGGERMEAETTKNADGSDIDLKL